MAGPLDLLRVDQVGSLLRPHALKSLLTGTDADPLREVEVQAAVEAVIREQEARGILPVVDGEFWRRGFQDTFPASVAGYAPAPAGASEQGGDGGGQISEATYVRRRPVERRLEIDRNVLLAEYLADRALTDRPVKVTLTGPERLTQRFDLEHSGDVYDGFDDFMADVVRIEREMIGQVVAAGCGYVQIDEPAYTAYVDPTSLEWMAERHWDPASGLARAIEADNALIAGLDGPDAGGPNAGGPNTGDSESAGATFGLHICRGNAAGHWHREGAYDAIAEQLFSGLAYPRLLLEYDTERAGGFEPLRFVRPGTVAVLGLVSTKTGTLETRDQLLARIEEASKFLPVEQLAISPQCGFASGLAGNPLTADEQWRKLELVRDVAAEVWS